MLYMFIVTHLLAGFDSRTFYYDSAINYKFCGLTRHFTAVFLVNYISCLFLKNVQPNLESKKNNFHPLLSELQLFWQLIS